MVLIKTKCNSGTINELFHKMLHLCLLFAALFRSSLEDSLIFSSFLFLISSAASKASSSLANPFTKEEIVRVSVKLQNTILSIYQSDYI